MNTKWLLTLILLLAVLSAFSSATALFLVVKDRSDFQQSEQRISGVENGSLTPPQSRGNQDLQPAELPATHDEIMKGLSKHIQSLGDSIRELSDRFSPQAPGNGVE